MLFAGWFHYHKAAPKLAWLQDVESMLNHHLAGLLGLGSLSWFCRGINPIFYLELVKSKYVKFLTFRGGLDPVTGGLWLTDISHHHLAIAIFFLIVGHMYRTNWGIGHGQKEILEAHKGPFTGEGHQGLYEILTTYVRVFNHSCSSPYVFYAPYPYLTIDYGTQLSLFTHHMWIDGFLIVDAAAHAALFMVIDYDPTTQYNDLLEHVLRHHDAIISHLNWACLFLGFHNTAIQLQPIFAQSIQNTHPLAPGETAPGAITSTSLTWGGALLPMPLGTAYFFVHHIHALTIHVTVLILLKGVLFARSSRLILDKANLGICFPCDEPGRGGTCQVSAWDHVFLGLLWMYNAISVVIFSFNWKIHVLTHITGGNFAQSSITINGWLRDFLWARASQVIQSYGSSLSAYGLFFLGISFGPLV
ncbi:hypothetical protein AMTRI_Chr13g88260 [Amborella trichopoda]